MTLTLLLDLLGALLGLLYFYFAVKESLWTWVTGMVMPVIYVIVLYQKGIYADAAMELYYFLAGAYGLIVWRFYGKKTKKELAISHAPRRTVLPSILVTLLLWVGIFLVLKNFTDSRVPIIDSFTTALSIVALWMLSRKYVEQWIVWLVVDAISAGLYISKGIPFRAILYATYTVLAIYGYRSWLRKCSLT